MKKIYLSLATALVCCICMTQTTKAQLTANFSWSPVCVNINDTIVFTDLSTGGSPFVVSWSWDFGDGNISTLQNPTHQYSTLGTYNVMLIVADSFGTDTLVTPLTLSTLFISITGTNTTCNGCADGTATATVSGGAAPYVYLWSGGETTATISGLSAGAYSVTVSDSNGCTLTASVSITDPSTGVTASFSFTSSCLITDPVNFTGLASGGVTPYTYSWSFTGGTPATSTAFNPSVIWSSAGTYSVTLVVSDANLDADTIIQSVTVPNDVTQVTITGNVTASTVPVNNGQVTIYYDDLSGAPMSTVATAPLDTFGDFTAGPITGGGNYIIMAEADTLLFPDAVPTFYVATHRWDSATALVAVCGSAVTLTANINIIEVPALTGTSSLSGVIVTTGKKADPVPGVSISVEQIPGGVIASHTTDSTGTYSFNNVPQGNFTFHISVPGKEMETNYSIGLTTDDSTITGLNFLVGDSTITTTNLTTSREEMIGDLFNTNLYPNPHNQFTTFEYTIEKAADVKITVYNMLGELVFSESTSKRAAGTHSMRFGAKELGEAPGVYTINIRVGDEMHSTMLVKHR